MRLEGKRAVVTGGAAGIGRAIVERFAREGAEVVAADIDLERGRQLAEQLTAEGRSAGFIEADVTEPEAVTRLVDQARRQLGGIDVWVNNAGGTIGEELHEIEPEVWQADVAFNLNSQYLCCRAVLPVMIDGGGGSLINISSVNALWGIGEFAYSAAKAAVISLTKNIAVTYGPQGIRANVICPGTILTESCAAYWDNKAGAKEKLLKWYPVRRLGVPDDVAYLALYLASDESSFVTGATLVIDGGLTAGCRLFGAV